MTNGRSWRKGSYIKKAIVVCKKDEVLKGRSGALNGGDVKGREVEGERRNVWVKEEGW